jgi:prophage regulatory protein
VFGKHPMSYDLSPSRVFVSFPELKQNGIAPWTRVHLNRLIKKGQFPAPISLSPNRLAWRMSDLEAWIASRPSARPGGATAAEAPGKPLGAGDGLTAPNGRDVSPQAKPNGERGPRRVRVRL